MPKAEDCRYTKEHEWVYPENDHTVWVGITDFAQQELGDIVYVDMPEAGQSFGAGDEMGTIESVKAVAEVYAPIAGELLEVNDSLADSPEKVNSDPMADGWLIKMKPADSSELDKLMSHEDYQKFLEEADH